MYESICNTECPKSLETLEKYFICEIIYNVFHYVNPQSRDTFVDKS